MLSTVRQNVLRTNCPRADIIEEHDTSCLPCANKHQAVGVVEESTETSVWENLDPGG